MHINPDVIFEELDYYSFIKAYNEQQPFSIETDAITMYLQEHTIEHIPVDTFEIEGITKEEKNYQYNFIYNNYTEYKILINKQYYLTKLFGFEFLNSPQHIELIEKIQNMEKCFFQTINDEKLKDIYRLWTKITNDREETMIKNIYHYSNENSFNKAVFLIGAEHITTIQNKAKKYNIGKPELNWLHIIKDFIPTN